MADKVTHITEFFGDGEHKFSIHPTGSPAPLDLWRELEEKTNAGPMRLFTRIRTGDFRADDIRETIRLGLIGGGKTPSQAYNLMSRNFDKAPLAEHAPLALDILLAGLYGIDPEGTKPVVPIVPVDEEAAEINAAVADDNVAGA
jgi:hypothetical protein